MDYGIFNVRTDGNACDCTRGCTDTVTESALKVDSVRKSPRRTGESNLRRQRAGPMVYELSYIPTQLTAHSFHFTFEREREREREKRERFFVSDSVQSLDRLGRRGDMRDDSAVIFQSFFCTRPLIVRCPLFDIVHPAFPLPTTTSPTLQGALKHGFGEAVVACDTPELCKFPSLWQLPEEFPVDARERWSCPASSGWSCAPSRRYISDYNVTKKQRERES